MNIRTHIARAGARRTVLSLSDSLLDEIRPGDLADAHERLASEVWELAADLDLLQSWLAGSRFWKVNQGGCACRSPMLREIESLLVRATELDLPRTAATLDELARTLRRIGTR